MKNTYKYATDNPLTQKDTTKNMFMEFLGLWTTRVRLVELEGVKGTCTKQYLNTSYR